MNSLQKSVSQATGHGSKIETSLARLYLEGDSTRSIPLVEQDALLDDPALDRQWGPR